MLLALAFGVDAVLLDTLADQIGLDGFRLRKEVIMVSRRNALFSIGAIASVATATNVAAQQSCDVFTPATQAATTPDAALALLKAGNTRFVEGRTINCDLRKQVLATAEQQSPVAVVVGCIDSRVPPEMVFDQRLGDIFAARVAGNFVNTDILGSLEFATAAAGAKLIVPSQLVPSHMATWLAT